MLNILVPLTPNSEERVVDLASIPLKWGESCLEEIFWGDIDESLYEVSALVDMAINYGYDENGPDEQPIYINVTIMENTDNEKIIEAFKKLCKDSIYFIPKFSKNSPIGTFKSNAEDALTTILVVYDDNDDDNCITAYQKREDFLESLELKGTNTNFGDIADIKEFANAVYNSLKSTNGIRFCVFEKC